MSSDNDAVTAVTVDRRTGPYGEVVLRRRGADHEIIANGVFLMDTSDGRSERLLVRAAADALDGTATAPAVLIGGLGVGFSLAEAAADARWGRITVVEREPAVIEWHTGPAGPGAAGQGPGADTGAAPLARISGPALADPRVDVVESDLLAYVETAPRRYDALCLDIDNGPDWTVTEDNDGLYAPAGLAACRDRLAPGGVLAVWSARPSTEFEAALRAAGYVRVRTEEIPVRRGAPDAVHLAVRPPDTAVRSAAGVSAPRSRGVSPPHTLLGETEGLRGRDGEGHEQWQTDRA